ncbi:hypothetical protein [Caldiplasma sukawensis]
MEAEETFNEIKDLPTSVFRKLFENKEVFNDIILTLFPEKKTLRLLLGYFMQKSNQSIYRTLYNELNNLL